MFMRFRGGDIGHLITREWDSFLCSDGHTFDESEGKSEVRNGGAGEVGEGEEGEGDEDKEVGETDEDEGEEQEDEGRDEGDSSEDEDRVVPDEGEELDDDLYGQEGYGAL